MHQNSTAQPFKKGHYHFAFSQKMATAAAAAAQLSKPATRSETELWLIDQIDI